MGSELETGWSQRTVGDVVAEDYRRASVFKQFGIDFCCGGGRSVVAACEKAGADPVALAEALAEAGRGRAASTDEGLLELDALVEHIVTRHHRYVRESTPVLHDFAAKVARVHGERHPELLEIRDLLGELLADLERHMAEEEESLFPRIAVLSRSAPAPSPGGDIQTATLPLEDDHARAGELMDRIRSLSGDFTPPADGCNTYRATYAKLEEFEEDLHRHVHLENNVLFPRAAEAEAAMETGTAAI